MLTVKPVPAKRDASANAANQPYRPKIGEILVKDSILYAQKPATVRHLRRQLWPIMEETMDTIAKGVATGAKILHHMMRPNLVVTGDPVYVRRVPTKQATMHIKGVYPPMALMMVSKRPAAGALQAAAKPPPAMAPLKAAPAPKATPSTTTTTAKPFTLPKPSHIVANQRPVNTISEDYVLRYSGDDPGYNMPTIRTHSMKTKSSAWPFGDMGVTGYKHFEATVLRELEEKEERRVEASMATDAARPVGGAGAADAEWQPMMSVSSTLRPHEMSALHTDTAGLEIKPVHEDVQETKTGALVALPVEQLPKPSRYSQRKPHKPTVVATIAPTEATKSAVTTASSELTTRATTLDVPNYPDFFIQEKRHLHPPKKAAALVIATTTTRSKSTTTTTTLLPKDAPAKRRRKPVVANAADDDLNAVLDFGRYRQHFQHVGATAAATPYRSNESTGAGGDMETSQSQSRTVLAAGARPPRVSNRNRPTAATVADAAGVQTAPSATAAAVSRGRVRFGDRPEVV